MVKNMEREVITTKQSVALLTMFMMGSALIHSVQSKANQDFWISYLFVVAFTLCVYFAYGRILSLFPNMDLLTIQRFLLGKYVGGIIYGFYIFHAFSLGAFVTRHYCEFIQIMSMPETPQYALAICMILVAIYATRNGIETLEDGAYLYCQ
jgi:spore germination protein KB